MFDEPSDVAPTSPSPGPSPRASTSALATAGKGAQRWWSTTRGSSADADGAAQLDPAGEAARARRRDLRAIKKRLEAFCADPGPMTYLAARDRALECEDDPMSDDVGRLERLVVAGAHQQALRAVDVLGPGALLAPRVHMLAAAALDATGQPEKATKARALGRALLHRGIRATGDGSQERPYVTSRKPDAWDVLQALGWREPISRQRVVVGTKQLDRYTRRDGREAFFDVTALVRQTRAQALPTWGAVEAVPALAVDLARFKEAASVVVVVLSGTLDRSTWDTLTDTVSALRARGYQHVVFELSGIDRIDVQGAVRLLVEASSLEAGGGVPVFLRPSQPVRLALASCPMLPSPDVTSDEQGALAVVKACTRAQARKRRVGAA